LSFAPRDNIFANACTLLSEKPKSAGGFRPGFAQLRDFVEYSKCLPNLLYSHVSLFFGIMKDPQAPWTAKLAATLIVGYVLSPIQLIPSFIPIIGQIDDVAVIWLGMTMIRNHVGEEIMAKHLATLPNRERLQPRSKSPSLGF
jgi:uncharacterized membrane protein YkvA (DUF1232 family)